MRATLIALIVIGSLQAAHAQSKKYPPITPDKELAEEKRSDLWDGALHPDMRPYKELLRDAKRLIDHNTPDDIKAGIEKLDAAIMRLPKEAEAYLMRGQLFLAQKLWAKCADDLARAEDFTKVTDLAVRTRSRIELGNCQARAGRWTEAENTFVRATASAQTQRSELWMRLGEVRIALGKLDEAIDALTAALDADSSSAFARWLLATAYDRARRPSEAAEHAQMAARFDPSRTHIDHPNLPLISTSEADYMSGLAHRYAAQKPEYALVYFRRFAKVATESPWKRRADEHVRELSAIKFPAQQTITANGTSTVQIDEMQKLLEKPVATMRQCLANLATSAFQVSVTRVGPRTPDTVRDRPIYRLPRASSKVSDDLLNAGLPKDVVDETKRCLEMQADKLQLPMPKERDTYYVLSFIVISP
jgi:tetratricopeptide (TPR) repeat protein